MRTSVSISNLNLKLIIIRKLRHGHLSLGINDTSQNNTFLEISSNITFYRIKARQYCCKTIKTKDLFVVNYNKIKV